jgi:hypothetical protein
MTKQLHLTFALLGLVSLWNCQTPPKPTASYIPSENPSEVIDLNQVKMVPMLDPDGKIIKITTNEDGKPVALLSLEYSNSGLDVIDAIQRGEILEHAIIIRDETGDEIGKAPINILQYEVDEIASNRGEHKILFTNSGSEINIKKSNELPPVERRGRVRIFKNNEIIPQYIELKKQPKEGAHISAYIELIYVKPYMDAVCKKSEDSDSRESVGVDANDVACPGRNFHDEVKSDTESVIQEKQSILSTAVSQMTNSTSIPKEYREQLVLSPKKEINEYRNSIKSNVNKSNPEKFSGEKEDLFSNHAVGHPHGSRYYYREWRLVSSPRFFQISTTDTPRKAHKRKVVTDYTHFENGEDSTQAEVENVVIEVSQPEPAKTVTKTEIPEESKKFSLQQAAKQKIGKGSPCKIYLKTGRFFAATLVDLEGYEAIQVEVNGQVMDVPKKDIEVIYFPKTIVQE